MPENLLAALVLLLVILPGMGAERIYRSLVGVNWREKDWQTVLRLLGFSVSGVTIYSLVAAVVRLPPPTHLFPATYQTAALNPSTLAGAVFLPYAGHFLGGTIAGATAAIISRFLGRFSSNSVHPSAWDDFIRQSAPGHWVTVGLANGEVYAGRLGFTDVGVASGDRDLILEEPALYMPLTGQYMATTHQHLFISAANLVSIATYYDEARDSRTVPPGESLFPAGRNEQIQPASAVEPATPEPRVGREGRLSPQSTDAQAIGTASTASAHAEAIESGLADFPERPSSPTDNVGG
jgi:hypothetical protein